MEGFLLSHSFLLDNKSRRGRVFLDRFSMNFCWWLIIPRNLRSSGTFLGRSIFSIAAVLSASGPIPWALRSWPANFSWCLENSHLSGFKVIFALVSLVKTLSNRLSFIVFCLCPTVYQGVVHGTDHTVQAL